MQIIEITQKSKPSSKRCERGYDSRDHRALRLTTVAKVSYGSLRNKGKDSTLQVLALNIQLFA